MNLLCSCVLYMYGFDFYPFTHIFIIDHKGTIFSQNKSPVSECIFFSYKNVASKSFYNQTWTKKRNKTKSFIPIGSNIQFSTNTEKEQVIIKKNLQQWTNRISVCIDPFSSNIVGILYHLIFILYSK
jgi:hypothetical protein